ncbi:MBOAT family protein [uncultured Clostridium sp.]|uniref:MBOAT family O-acyltransferase n=1 Tax=uncultured Clostridium sp. TaxID=59620 RepID=UPI0025E566D6|nr:MBOAT family protein [uncultured Clostridium sp.]
MVFSSIVFLFYFLPIVLIGNYILCFSRRLQNLWLFVTSIFFYAWGEPLYVAVLLLSICVNYVIGIIVSKYRDKNRNYAKFFVFIACLLNLSNLFIFKYLGFVIDMINEIVGKDIIVFEKLSMPIGISFFTFQALSYVIDIYRKDAEVQKNPILVGLYIAFFPQLVAGPIVRYKTIAEQMQTRKFNINQFCTGICRFVVGLSKKILLANNLAIIVDNIYNLTETGKHLYDVSISMAWLGSIAYTLQIYMDFSGYSDMAIGLGQMFGFQFEENFNYPYITKSISEFWRRWHISLSTWFKEYVYFPLGGSRVKNKDKMIRNLLIVWLLTGIWHGASMTFIAWGLYNFIFIFCERLIGFDKKNSHPVLRHIYALVIINFGWVLFRSDDFYVLSQYLSNMFGLNNNSFYSNETGMIIREYALVLIASIVFSMPTSKIIRAKIQKSKNKLLVLGMRVGYPVALTCTISLCVLCLVKGGYNPFIYFNF